MPITSSSDSIVNFSDITFSGCTRSTSASLKNVFRIDEKQRDRDGLRNLADRSPTFLRKSFSYIHKFKSTVKTFNSESPAYIRRRFAININNGTSRCISLPLTSYPVARRYQHCRYLSRSYFYSLRSTNLLLFKVSRIENKKDKVYHSDTYFCYFSSCVSFSLLDEKYRGSLNKFRAILAVQENSSRKSLGVLYSKERNRGSFRFDIILIFLDFPSFFSYSPRLYNRRSRFRRKRDEDKQEKRHAQHGVCAASVHSRRQCRRFSDLFERSRGCSCAGITEWRGADAPRNQRGGGRQVAVG